jgi:hypothetical protein
MVNSNGQRQRQCNNQPNDGAAWRLGAMVNGTGNSNNGAAWSSFDHGRLQFKERILVKKEA